MVLGRSAGLNEAKLAHLGDEVVPEGVYEPDEAAIVEYSRRSTLMQTIDDALYGRLRAHFSPEQIMEICFTVGMSNMINRFHATFLTDVDPETNQAVAASCALPMPDPLRARADAGWQRSAAAPPPGP
ncbi:MAG: carboxymuconolactone decarboxylase family protein [Acidimicrobiales bacterium]